MLLLTCFRSLIVYRESPWTQKVFGLTRRLFNPNSCLSHQLHWWHLFASGLGSTHLWSVKLTKTSGKFLACGSCHAFVIKNHKVDLTCQLSDGTILLHRLNKAASCSPSSVFVNYLLLCCFFLKFFLSSIVMLRPRESQRGDGSYDNEIEPMMTVMLNYVKSNTIDWWPDVIACLIYRQVI